MIKKSRLSKVTMMVRSTPLLSAVLAVLAPVSVALDNGLARLPHMGWRSWEAYYGGVDEAKMMATITASSDPHPVTAVLCGGFAYRDPGALDARGPGEISLL